MKFMSSGPENSGTRFRAQNASDGSPATMRLIRQRPPSPFWSRLVRVKIQERQHFTKTRLHLYIGGLLAIACVLPGQTVSPVRREGRYWVQVEEGSLPGGGRLRIRSVGSIVVAGADSRQVRYKATKKLKARNAEEARRLLESARLTASRQGTTAVLSITRPNCSQCNFSAELDVQAPRSTSDTILSTEGGSLEVNGLVGRVNADTAGGSIRMDQIGRGVRATTAGGGITLGSIGGGVRAETAGGSIRLERAGADAILTTSGGGITAGHVEGKLQAETAGGSIRAEQVGGSVFAATAGGSIYLGTVGGLINAETAGGSIHVASAPSGVHAEAAGGRIRLENVAGAVWAASASGSIDAIFLDRPLKASFLETNAGSIIVWLPATLAVTIEAVVDLAGNANRIRSDFPVIRVQREDQGFGPASLTARGELNGGGPVLRIRNMSGRIHIRRKEQLP